MERPRMFLKTLTTTSQAYVDLLVTKISPDAKGLSYFCLSIDPDPKALYRIAVARLMAENDLELTAIWTVELSHLTSGVYEGLNAGDDILIQQRSIDGTSVKTGITLEMNEVVEEKRAVVPVPRGVI